MFFFGLVLYPIAFVAFHLCFSIIIRVFLHLFCILWLSSSRTDGRGFRKVIYLQLINETRPTKWLAERVFLNYDLIIYL